MALRPRGAALLLSRQYASVPSKVNSPWPAPVIGLICAAPAKSAVPLACVKRGRCRLRRPRARERDRRGRRAGERDLGGAGERRIQLIAVRRHVDAAIKRAPRWSRRPFA